MDLVYICCFSVLIEIYVACALVLLFFLSMIVEKTFEGFYVETDRNIMQRFILIALTKVFLWLC